MTRWLPQSIVVVHEIMPIAKYFFNDNIVYMTYIIY